MKMWNYILLSKKNCFCSFVFNVFSHSFHPNLFWKRNFLREYSMYFQRNPEKMKAEVSSINQEAGIPNTASVLPYWLGGHFNSLTRQSAVSQQTEAAHNTVQSKWLRVHLECFTLGLLCLSLFTFLCLLILLSSNLKKKF